MKMGRRAAPPRRKSFWVVFAVSAGIAFLASAVLVGRKSFAEGYAQGVELGSRASQNPDPSLAFVSAVLWALAVVGLGWWAWRAWKKAKKAREEGADAAGGTGTQRP